MSPAPRRAPDYRPIRDYAVIGNQCSTALVRIDGSVDWCCLPHLDSPSVFAAVLDARRGGHFLIRPSSPVTKNGQRYRERTNVLVTTFEVEGGRLEVVDFMPIEGALGATGNARQTAEIHRHVRCTDGRVEVDTVWAPRPDYARGRTAIERAANGFVASAGGSQVWIAGVRDGTMAPLDGGEGPAVVERVSLSAGESRVLTMGCGPRPPDADPSSSRQWLETTVEAWHRWTSRIQADGGREWTGPWEDAVIRSELFLKLMTFPCPGALAAAPTTSLPETLGGRRNWDYRFAWIRDAAQIAQAFFAVGHEEHADAFVQWSEEVARQEERRSVPGLSVLYPLRPETDLTEVTLDHLEGYMGSSPVRVGNAAADQLQLDVYGELMNVVFERTRLSGRFDADLAPFLTHLADAACAIWRRPDFGIWEMKSGPAHLVHSKVMVWVALHRALWLEERGFLDGDADRWRTTMREIEKEVLRFGYSHEADAFVHRYRGTRLDAANLLIPVMEFLPADDPRVQATIQRTLDRLTVNDLVYRYRLDDGLPGEEGCFVLCTCWLVDALALSGRVDEARRIFEALVSRANHVGLLAEQIDPYSGAFLGNFPQAYSHLGIINSTLYLAWREGRELPISPLLGARD